MKLLLVSSRVLLGRTLSFGALDLLLSGFGGRSRFLMAVSLDLLFSSLSAAASSLLLR